MKKAKVLLLTIAVFAVIGGAVAFKAKTAYGAQYCTTNVNPNNGGKCDIERFTTINSAKGGAITFYYTLPQSGECVPGVTGLSNCPSTTFYDE